MRGLRLHGAGAIVVVIRSAPLCGELAKVLLSAFGMVLEPVHVMLSAVPPRQQAEPRVVRRWVLEADRVAKRRLPAALRRGSRNDSVGSDKAWIIIARGTHGVEAFRGGPTIGDALGEQVEPGVQHSTAPRGQPDVRRPSNEDGLDGQRQEPDRSGVVEVALLDGWRMLELRGGGSLGGHQRTLGAGMSAFMDEDSDQARWERDMLARASESREPIHEAHEADGPHVALRSEIIQCQDGAGAEAEPEPVASCDRLEADEAYVSNAAREELIRNERLLLGESCAGAERGVTRRPGVQVAPRSIIGEQAGYAVAICMSCWSKFPRALVCVELACCARRVCAACASGGCRSCEPLSTHAPPRIYLADAVGNEACTHVTALESPAGEVPSGGEPAWELGPGRMSDTAVDGHHGPSEQEGAMDNMYAHSDSNAAWGGVACHACGINFQRGCTTWYVCSCGALYCVQCGSSPCVDCPARWGQNDAGNLIQGQPTAEPEPIYAPTPMRLSPDDALNRRTRMMKDNIQRRRDQRAEHRALRKVQIRNGLRPRRDRASRRGVRFIGANVTAESSWKAEQEHGSLLRPPIT